MPQDEPDINNFSTSSEHRLPAVTGVQALQDELRKAKGIATGLTSLDTRLNALGSLPKRDGLRRGVVTEAYGPPGSGKSSFGLQVAVNAIRCLDQPTKVVWISAGTKFMHRRLQEFISGPASSEPADMPSSPPKIVSDTAEIDDHFILKEVSSLSHLLTMLMHPTSVFPPPNTSLLVIDGLPNFLLGALPRPARGDGTLNTILQDAATKKANSKRFQLVENLAAALSHLAASRHIAVLVLTNATTSVKTGQKAMLKPALSGQSWDAAINTRVMLYRDLYPQQYRAKLSLQEKRFYRLAEVTRLNCKDVQRDPVPFVIEMSGLRELDLGDIQLAATDTVLLPVPEETFLNIRTSQPEQQPALPLDFPTASQVLEQETTAFKNGPTDTNCATEHEDANGSRVMKRKAIEIADSEDEDEVDDAPEPTLPPAPATEAVHDEQEEMLFDKHEGRKK